MPNTVNKGLNTPNTGDLTGAWGTAAINANMQVIDGYLGGVVSLALTSSNVSLTISTGVIGTGSLTPGSGPVQADNAVIKLSGTLTGNPVITFPCPGYWIVHNDCVVGTRYVQLRASGTGSVIAAPPGRACHVYCDGTNVAYVNMPEVGSLMNLVVSTTQAWMTACTTQPWLVCNGATYSTSSYTALAALLGSTWGGNGVSTFGVPELRNRVQLMLGSTITTSSGGLNGAAMAAAGGTTQVRLSNGNLPGNIPYTDPTHNHGMKEVTISEGTSGNVSVADNSNGSDFSTGLSSTNITINPSGASTPFNIVQPSVIFGCTFIKT